MASPCGKLFLSSLSTVFSPSLRELGVFGVLEVSRLGADQGMRGLGTVGEDGSNFLCFGQVYLFGWEEG